jgi:hypothetical protein
MINKKLIQMKNNHIVHIFDYGGDDHISSRRVPNVHSDIRLHLRTDQQFPCCKQFM